MLQIDITLSRVRDRQAALLASAVPGRHARHGRPNAVRRQLGAWIVRLGLAIAGRPGTSLRPA